MNNQVIIRPAKPNEHEKIVDLYKKEGPPERIKKIRKDVKKNFKEMKLGKRLIFFAEVRGKVVGTVQLAFELPDKDLADKKSVVNLHHLRVDEDYRHRGIGRRLEQELVKLAKRKGFKKISLSVEHDQSYDFLRNLYQKWGYSFLKENPKANETCFYKKIKKPVGADWLKN